MLVARDATQRIRLREMRKDFVDDVSHELRTPLTVIRGYTELLLDDAFDYHVFRKRRTGGSPYGHVPTILSCGQPVAKRYPRAAIKEARQVCSWIHPNQMIGCPTESVLCVSIDIYCSLTSSNHGRFTLQSSGQAVKQVYSFLLQYF